MERLFIGIVIPALNEEQTIEQVVSQTINYGIPIVVDDGSKDDTFIKALQAGANVYKHNINMGYEAALSTGFDVASKLGCKFVITIDADGQHNPYQLEEFIKQLELGYSLVMGCRDKTQRFSEKFFSWTGKLLWGISDPLCGLKGYQIQNYLKLGTFNTFPSLGTELAIRSILSGASFIEVPVTTKERFGKSRFGSGFKANYKILKALILLICFQITHRLDF